MKNLKSLLVATLILLPNMHSACQLSGCLRKVAGVGAIAGSVYSALLAVETVNNANGVNVDEGSLVYKLDKYIQNSRYFNGSVGKSVKKHLLLVGFTTSSIVTYYLGRNALVCK